MSEPHLWAYVDCVFCGKSFRTDCGEAFCSSSCEDAAEEYEKECERCGYQQCEYTFPDGKHCENCIDEMEEKNK